MYVLNSFLYNLYINLILLVFKNTIIYEKLDYKCSPNNYKNVPIFFPTIYILLPTTKIKI